MDEHTRWLAAAFVTLTLLVAAAVPLGVGAATRRTGGTAGEARRAAAGSALAVIGWLGLTWVLAAAGILGFEGRPPTMVLALLAMWAVALTLGFSGTGARLASGLPLAALVGFHAFRLPLELIMHRAYLLGLMPVQMSYSGWNFDILTGATAALLAVAIAGGRAPLLLVRLWNGMGIVLLLNIVTIAVLSTPVPFRMFTGEPANVWITRAPWVWLPMVFVLGAIVGHILVARRLRIEAGRAAGSSDPVVTTPIHARSG
jgi:hypothetical protein